MQDLSWTAVVDQVIHWHNTTPRQSGASPHELLLGKRPIYTEGVAPDIALALQEAAAAEPPLIVTTEEHLLHQSRARERNDKYHTLSKGSRQHCFSIGEAVIFRPRKGGKKGSSWFAAHDKQGYL